MREHGRRRAVQHGKNVRAAVRDGMINALKAALIPFVQFLQGHALAVHREVGGISGDAQRNADVLVLFQFQNEGAVAVTEYRFQIRSVGVRKAYAVAQAHLVDGFCRSSVAWSVGGQ